jgi:cell division protein FtsB
VTASASEPLPPSIAPNSDKAPKAARKRSRAGLVLPEVLTVRLLALAVVALIATVLLVPTVRATIQQSMDLRALRADNAAQQAKADALQGDIARWNDPAYVESQARERLLFQMPGDTVWRTIGADKVVENVDPNTGVKVDAGIVGGQGEAGTPWYTTVWESVQAADNPPDAQGDSAGSTDPVGSSDSAGSTGSAGSTDPLGSGDSVGSSDSVGANDPAGSTDSAGSSGSAGSTDAVGVNGPAGLTDSVGPADPTP